MGNISLFGLSLFDLVAGGLGIYMYQVVWDILNMAGFAVIAFAAAIYESLHQNFESDDVNDEPEQQLRRLEVRLWFMVFCVIFVATPTLTITNLELRVPSQTCNLVPTAGAAHLKLTPEQELYLAKHGAYALVNKEYEETRVVGGNHQRRIKTVAARLLRGEALAKFARIEARSPRGITRGLVAALIEQAKQNEREQKALNRFGLTISGLGTLKAPVWWMLWRNQMLGVNAAATTRIPCGDDVRLENSHLEAEFLPQEELKAEFLEFYDQCHLPAVATWKEDSALYKSHQIPADGIVEKRLEEVATPGNKYLFGYLGRIRAQTPREGFGVIAEEKGFDGSSATAPGSANPEAVSGSGYPKCDVWWNHSAFGLSKKLKSFYALDTISGQERVRERYNLDTTDTDDMLEVVLSKKIMQENKASVIASKAIVNQLQGGMTGSQEVTSDENWVMSALGYAVDWGILTSYAERMAGLRAMFRAMPAATSVLIMMFTAVIPVGLIVGRFALGPTMGITISYISFYLWFPYFRFVRWIDDNLAGMMGLGTESTTKMMLDFMVGAAYVAVPMIITSILTLAGIRLASFDPIGGATMGSIGQTGMKSAINLGKSAFKAPFKALGRNKSQQ
ncbi:TPA: hypothetical protein I7682_18050 [Vibrio vulnificus]|nr:hypothetical protein [Vibrio vulnificus]